MTIIGIPPLEGKYPSTMDIWPIEAPEFNKIHGFYDNLKINRFTTTQCRQCQQVTYPPRILCPSCYSDEFDYIDLPQTAKVISYAVHERGVPLGFEAPLILAWLDLGKGSPIKRMMSRIINCADGDLKEGDLVRFVTISLPSHPIEVKRDTKMAERFFFAFEPVT